MESIKELLIKKHLEIVGNEPTEEEWEPRIRNMLSIVCQNRFHKEDIVTLIDTGIGSNGGAGMVFTTKALCVKDWGNSTTRFIAYFKDIEYCLLEEDRFWGLDISKIELHMKSGRMYKLSSCLHGFELEEMKDFIEYAMSLYQHSDTEAPNPDDKTQDIDDEEELDPSDILHIANVFVSKTISALTGKISGS